MNEKKNELQMSEAFLTSIFWRSPADFRMPIPIIRGRRSSNAQTGNVVLMSQNFMVGRWMDGLRYLFPLLAFAFGVFLRSAYRAFQIREAASLETGNSAA